MRGRRRLYKLIFAIRRSTRRERAGRVSSWGSRARSSPAACWVFCSRRLSAARSATLSSGRPCCRFPEKVAGAALLEVLFRDLEAVIGAAQHPQALLGFGVIGIGKEDAVGLHLAPAHPAAQLVELR